MSLGENIVLWLRLINIGDRGGNVMSFEDHHIYRFLLGITRCMYVWKTRNPIVYVFSFLLLFHSIMSSSSFKFKDELELK